MNIFTPVFSDRPEREKYAATIFQHSKRSRYMYHGYVCIFFTPAPFTLAITKFAYLTKTTRRKKLMPSQI